MYPLYDVRTGRRLRVGPPTGAYGDTYGSPIFTGAEFHALLKHIRSMGFHVYANSHFGGINYSAHSPKSWHYVKDAQGRSLAADIGTYGDVNERTRIILELIPLLDRLGVAWHYARDGHVPNHWDHIHIDVSNWGRKGGTAPSHGYYTARKKASPLTALAGGKKRQPKRIAAYYGSKGSLVRIVQKIAKAKVDGSFGLDTANAVKKLQRSLGVVQDGSFGPATARAYLAKVAPVRRLGNTGQSVRLIQYIAGITIDGSYGPATENAVKEMQRWAGLVPDGVFGPASRSKLIR